jgi:thiol-disulfide isomerase/thioredoxin
VLVATPKDFGFFGKGEGEESGRYAPLKSAASHDRFRADLSRMITLLLQGKSGEARASAASAANQEITALPPFSLTDFDGKPLSRESVAGRPVVIEFWATWCPPCRSTLRWLGELERRHGGKIAVAAIAVESGEDEARKVASQLALPIRWAMGQAEMVRAFGDLGAVPTLFLFDGAGRTEAVFYGAPPTLHSEVEAKLDGLLGRK